MKKKTRTGLVTYRRKVLEILGYLDIQDIARASTLSKEFNKICTLLRRFCIDSEKIGDDPNKREDFFEFLNCHTEKVLEEKSLRCVNLRWKLSETREKHVVKDYWNLKLNAVQYLYVHTNRAAQPKKAVYLRRFPSLEYLSIRSYLDDDAARTGVKLRKVKLGGRLREWSSQCYWESANSEHLEFIDQIKILVIDIDKEDLIKPKFISCLTGTQILALSPVIFNFIVSNLLHSTDHDHELGSGRS
ncbi:hypothetical protein ACLB2K_005289 [Fragaria x ananassa]